MQITPSARLRLARRFFAAIPQALKSLLEGPAIRLCNQTGGLAHA